MANHITRLVLDNSDFNSEFGKSAKFVREFFKGIDDLNNGMIGLSGQQKSFLLNLGKTPTSAKNAEVAIEQLKYIMDSLSKSYNKMSDDVRKGDVGTAAAKAITDLTNRIAALKAEMATVGTTKRMYVSPSTTVSGGSGESAAAGAAASAASDLGSGGSAFGAIFKGNLAARALMDSLRELKSVTEDAIKANIDFEYSNATLAAVLGKSKEEISDLTEQAKELGRTSLYSAKEISELQIVLARRGFDNTQVKAMTESISQLATATASDLGKATELVGATLSSFEMKASSANDVAATLGVATTKCALDMEKLKTALGYVGAKSHSFGLSLEETVSMLGVLSDAGISASTSGVVVRNILTDLANSSSRLSKAIGHPVRNFNELIAAFEELKKKGVDLNMIVEKRVSNGFEKLVNNTDRLVELKNSITGVRDELQTMVDKQIDTMQGSLTVLKNSWDGLMLSFQSSISGPIRKVAESLTKAINNITKASNNGDLKRGFQNVKILAEAAAVGLVTFKVACNIDNIVLNLGIAIEKLTAKFKALVAVVAKNPYAAAAAAIAALGVAVYKFNTRIKENYNSFKILEEVEKDSGKYAAESITRFNLLTSTMRDANKPLDERKKALEKIIELVPEYNGALTSEGTLIKDNVSALDRYIEKLKQVAMAHAAFDRMVQLNNERINKEIELRQAQDNLASVQASVQSNLNPSENPSLIWGPDAGSGFEVTQGLIDLTRAQTQVTQLENDIEGIDESLTRLEQIIREAGESGNLAIETATETTTTTGGGGGSTTEKTELEKQQERVADALIRYAASINVAQQNLDKGSADELETNREKLRAEERLQDVYSNVIETLKAEQKNVAETEPYWTSLNTAITTFAQAFDECGNRVKVLKDAIGDAKDATDNYEKNLRIKQQLVKIADKYGLDHKDVGLRDTFDYHLLNEDSWKSIQNEANNALSPMHVEIEIDFESGYVSKVDKLKRDINYELKDLSNYSDNFSTIINGIDNLKTSTEDLIDTLNEEGSAWDKLFATLNYGISIFDTVITVLQAINALKILIKSATVAETAATITETAAQEVQTGSTIGLSVANEVLAKSSTSAANGLIAEANASVAAANAGIPVVGAALATAGMATISSGYAASNAAAFASTAIMHAAKGGIVPGSYNGGIDTVPAILSPGELILNRSQQNSIAAQLQGAGVRQQSVQVYGRVSGKDILLASNNYNRARGGSRSAYTQIK